ncbi:Spo0B C-terminal domain-containing protein [Alkalihalobacillus trypoxylicola]|uniref:Sporulation initiation phosphotransferase B C-terminal domain-containing protein n=1 Tax=Alkalihalobacillus trypoxylicola TaxID=519424 RepID=A0A162E690_9BACI|nr:Spo0B C-terminal domain-containing protein [Alkalihalobacillus trypoxylicola]KYG31851.1 hypothetical protein AZF04_03475 [Alkalihalobacillus trypoxylicola]
MAKNNEILEALRHSRHDWLNVLQLIKSNLALKKYDRIDEIISQSVQQSVNASKLSNLGIPRLATHLLTYNWQNNKMKLEVNVIGDERDLQAYENSLEVICFQVLSLFNSNSVWTTENQLLLTFILKNYECELLFDFEGQLKIEEKQLEEFLSLQVPINTEVEWGKDTCFLKASVELN